jgi:lipopolysaccharide biosynthesis glycosyltransferase
VLFLDDSICDTNTDRLMVENYARDNNTSAYFLSVDSLQFSKLPTSFRWNKVIYLALIPHLILPLSLERVLLLDLDITVLKDISEYYFTEFGDNIVISPELKVIQDKISKLSAVKASVFCVGTCLVNLKVMRQLNVDVTYYLNIVKKEYAGIFPHSYEQGLLNIAFWQRTLLVPEYICPIFGSLNSKPDLKRIDNNEIYMIHMCSFLDPWVYYFGENDTYSSKMLNRKLDIACSHFSVHEERKLLFSYWWKYAKQAPNFEQLKYDALIREKYYLKYVVHLIKIVNSPFCFIRMALKLWKLNKCYFIDLIWISRLLSIKIVKLFH